jgi:hypothetical protein
MSQDDPNEGDRENEAREEGPGPRAPTARSTGSTLNEAKFPRAEPGARSPLAQSRNGSKLRKKHALPFLALVAVCVLIVIVANPGGSATHTKSVVNEGGKVSHETESTPRPETTPPPKPTLYKLAYPPAEMTFEGGTPYNIDHRRLVRGGGLGEPEVDGFRINTYPDPGGNVTRFEVTGQSGRVASWAGQGEPNATGCKQALEPSGLREVVLKHQGQWLCAETDKGYVALIRYDGSQSEDPPIYTLFARVYIPSHS